MRGREIGRERRGGGGESRSGRGEEGGREGGEEREGKEGRGRWREVT